MPDIIYDLGETLYQVVKDPYTPLGVVIRKITINDIRVQRLNRNRVVEDAVTYNGNTKDQLAPTLETAKEKAKRFLEEHYKMAKDRIEEVK